MIVAGSPELAFYAIGEILKIARSVAGDLNTVAESIILVAEPVGVWDIAHVDSFQTLGRFHCVAAAGVFNPYLVANFSLSAFTSSTE